ncbi:thiamine/thiamine pyrophosphate ABC transporter permease [Dongshaea marina]|uniref:thiamine/thiamine pyrophosphate ABC transporter permease n=1 Tax=Dongshaea marina TaxID=2047966 RepID=UPI000D3E6990|nr:thiamine/thiamine pyrophosphate ABC transporter permease [Dongshaea marina]
MKHRPLWWLPATVATLLILSGAIAPLGALLLQSSDSSLSMTLSDPYIIHVIVFSLKQATLSTLLSLILAIPIARALARRSFPGRSLLLRLFGLSLVLPVIVAVYGIVNVYGHDGWLNQLLELLQLPRWGSLYGLQGILLAHVFFNMPLCTRMLLQGIESIPSNNWRLASQLGMSSGMIFRLLEWPAMRSQLCGLISLVFMLCFTSFATVMALGGGPASTTLEVAIFQALRYNFDLQSAGQLALIQLALTCVVLLVNQWFNKPLPSSADSYSSQLRPDRHTLSSKFCDSLLILLGILIYLPPLLAIVISGLNLQLVKDLMHPVLWQACWTSLKIAVSSGLLSLLLAVLMLLTTRHLRIRMQCRLPATLLESCGSIILVLPGVVLSTGLFILLMPWLDVFGVGFYLVILVNALMALPYTLRTLNTPMQLLVQNYDKLCDSLGITGLRRLRVIEWHQLRRPIAIALSLGMILSVGDLGAIAMFGSDQLQTLPYLLYLQLGSYQTQHGAATALILLLLCFFIFWCVEKGLGGQNARDS